MREIVKNKRNCAYFANIGAENMSYNGSNVRIIAEQLRWAKDKGYSTALLLGAGMSYSANIPLANGMIAEVKRQFPDLASTCGKETYPAYMSLLAPAQRRQLIGSFVDNAKINLAHLYLGTLVKEKYIDRILTTNFDPLVVRSLALFNLYPAVYDFAASQAFIPGEVAPLSVFYLHGQRDGFVLLNTEEEINRHSEKIKYVFQDIARGRCWIVIGYSGENDPVFERLSEVDVFRNKLFWVGYKEEEPKEHVLEKILKPKNKFGYYVKGYHADSFFLELAKELNLPEPQIISKPFSHLKEAINNIAEFTVDDKLANPTKETKKWINIAINGFEKGKGFEHIKAAQKSRIDIDEMIRKTRDIWVHGKFSQIDKIIKSVLSSGIVEANKYLAFALNNWGTALLDLAGTKEGEEAEALFKQSFEKYEQSLKIKPDLHEALYNWGAALLDLARTKEGEEAEALFKQSFEKYEQSLKIKPDKYEALYNWGNALSDLAKTKKSEEAEALFEQSFEKYEQSLKIKPDKYETLDNWGNAISNLAKLKNDESLYRQSFEKYEKAADLNPKSDFAFYNWGNAIHDLAELKNDEALYWQSFEKYEKATALNPTDDSAFENWGNAISKLAELKKDEALYRQSFEKYEKATELNPKYDSAFYNWGVAIYNLAELKKDEALYQQSFEKLHKAVELDGSSYNLACVYAWKKEKNNALKYLENSLMKKEITVKFVEEDEDWEAYKNDIEFIGLLDKYRI